LELEQNSEVKSIPKHLLLPYVENGKCMDYEWDVNGQGKAIWDIWE